jgi:uncharacterized protein YhbP (UPF0306 family)
MSKTAALEYLSNHVLLNLATVSSSGRPHAAPIFYASDGASIFFSVAPGSESATNLAANPVASVSVADVPQDWGKARGLQITGNVSKASGDEQTKAASAFATRFSFLKGTESYEFLKLEAEEIHFVHNDEQGDEDIEALGVHWLRETVQP